MRVKFTALLCARVLHPSPEQLPSAKVKGQTARRTAPVHRSLIERAAAFSGELRQYRTNELVRRRMNFSSDAMADFEGLLEVNRKICKQQMAEKASPTLPTNCAVLP